MRAHRGHRAQARGEGKLVTLGVVAALSALLGAGVQRTLMGFNTGQSWQVGLGSESSELVLALAAVARRQNRTILELEAALERARHREMQLRLEYSEVSNGGGSFSKENEAGRSEPISPPMSPPTGQTGQTGQSGPPAGSGATTEKQTHNNKEAVMHKAREGEMSEDRKECEGKFGEGLVESYRSSKKTWCESAGGAGLECYSHRYEHNGRTGLFCVGTDVVIDFKHVKGSVHGKKQARGANSYLSFGPGATSIDCRKTKHWAGGVLMPHMAPQLKGIRFERIQADVEDTGTTYLLARDEDCENMFHSTADHLNAYMVGRVLDVNWQDVRTVLWDRHPDGPFRDLIEKSFSKRQPLARIADFHDKIVKFRRIVFHLESPAGIVFPKVAGPTGIMRCTGSSLWLGFKNHVLASFDLLHVKPPADPRIVFSVRRRTASKNVGRVFADEDAITNVLKKATAVSHEVVDLAALPFPAQLAKMRRANVLVGAHGAGLMHVLFLADEAVLLEIHPHYRIDRHFRLAARMTNKIYIPFRSTIPVKCSGSSDAIPVDPRAFELALDAALRVARAFDDGVAECGLVCDHKLLALDPGAAKRLPAGVKPLSTRFPCAR